MLYSDLTRNSGNPERDLNVMQVSEREQWRLAMSKTIKNRVKERVSSLLDPDATPHQIAMSFAVGTFIEILPAFGLKTLISVGVLSAFRSMNRLALLAAIALWNSFLIAPIYGMSYALGIKFLKAPGCGSAFNPLQAPPDCLLKIFLPSTLVVGLAIAIVTYAVLRLLISVRLRRAGTLIYLRTQFPEPMEARLSN